MPDAELHAALARLEAQHAGLRGDMAEVKQSLREIWTRIDDSTKQAQQHALQVAILAENAQHAGEVNRNRDTEVSRLSTLVRGNGVQGLAGRIEELTQRVEVLARAQDSGSSKVWTLVVVVVSVILTQMASLWIRG